MDVRESITILVVIFPRPLGKLASRSMLQTASSCFILLYQCFKHELLIAGMALVSPIRPHMTRYYINLRYSPKFIISYLASMSGSEDYHYRLADQDAFCF